MLKPRYWKKFWFGLVMVLIIPVWTMASVSNAAGDKEILNLAAKEVRMYPYFTIFDNVELTLNNGQLTVTGEVLEPWRKNDLGRILAKVPGVNDVDNQLEVLPLSSFDRQLRIRLARAIFSHPLLYRYGLGANPSIHIIVKNGNVKLVGTVNSEADRNAAALVAKTAATYFGFENKLQVETRIASVKP